MASSLPGLISFLQFLKFLSGLWVVLVLVLQWSTPSKSSLSKYNNDNIGMDVEVKSKTALRPTYGSRQGAGCSFRASVLLQGLREDTINAQATEKKHTRSHQPRKS